MFVSLYIDQILNKMIFELHQNCQRLKEKLILTPFLSFALETAETHNHTRSRFSVGQDLR